MFRAVWWLYQCRLPLSLVLSIEISLVLMLVSLSDSCAEPPAPFCSASCSTCSPEFLHAAYSQPCLPACLPGLLIHNSQRGPCINNKFPYTLPPISAFGSREKPHRKRTIWANGPSRDQPHASCHPHTRSHCWTPSVDPPGNNGCTLWL